MTKDELKSILRTMRTAYNLELTQDVCELWQRVIGELPFDLASRALDNYLKHSHEFAPKPGQIYEGAMQLRPRPVWQPPADVKKGGMTAAERELLYKFFPRLKEGQRV